VEADARQQNHSEFAHDGRIFDAQCSRRPDRVVWPPSVQPRQRDHLAAHAQRQGHGIAATELACSAGAQRVEGTLFGNGERTGNLDIVTVALNLFSQGVDSKLDFSDLPRVREVYERTTRMEVPPRAPYAGDLTFTAFSGSIRTPSTKVSRAQDPEWRVGSAVLALDPERQSGALTKRLFATTRKAERAASRFCWSKTTVLTCPKRCGLNSAKL
jgi:hypothetical protein